MVAVAWLIIWVAAIVVMAVFWDTETWAKVLVGVVIASIGLFFQSTIAAVSRK